MVTTTETPRLFSDPSCQPVLRPILAYCLEEHGRLSLVCRNVRHLLYTDPQLRDDFLDTMYGLPSSPPSLDGPLPSRSNNPRTPLDTENYLREQALRTFSPSLVRCVHTRGPVAAVRDGYMVSFNCKQGMVDKRPTGWVVWALPLWHEAQRTGVIARDKSKSLRSDPIDIRDVPMPPRPSGAVKEQAMWMWEFDLGKEVVAMAIQPEDNLLAVAVVPVIVSYAAGHDRRHSDTFRVGRRHRIYLFRMRPPGLGMSYAIEWGKPVKHPAAPRPFLEFIEPVSDGQEHVEYALKIGPNGLVALLVKPGSKDIVVNGPLVVWNWKLGVCAGVVSQIPESGRILDFDFMTDNHLVILEVAPLPRGDIWRHVDLPLVPHRCRLTVAQLSSAIARNADVVYHLISQPPSETFHHFLAQNCWTLDDCPDDNVLFVTSLELPPLLDKSMRKGFATPSSAVFGSVDIYPPLSEDFPQSQISFTVGCETSSQGVLVRPNQMLRGSISAEVVLALIPPSLQLWSIRAALKAWQKHHNDDKNSTFQPGDTLCELLERVVGILVNEHAARPFYTEDNSFIVAYDHSCRLSHGLDLFRNIVKTADKVEIMDLAGGSQRHKLLLTALGGPSGVDTNGRIFAKLLPPLETTKAALQTTEFRTWCRYADIEILPSASPASVYGCRVVYADPSPPSQHLIPPTDGSEEEDYDGSFTLVMRNHPARMQCPRDGTPGAAVSNPPERSRLRSWNPLPSAQPRYTQCPCPPRAVHTPWLGDTVHNKTENAVLLKGSHDTTHHDAMVGVACGKGEVQNLWFDGQTIILGSGDRVTLVCF